MTFSLFCRLCTFPLTLALLKQDNDHDGTKVRTCTTRYPVDYTANGFMLSVAYKRTKRVCSQIARLTCDAELLFCEYYPFTVYGPSSANYRTNRMSQSQNRVQASRGCDQDHRSQIMTALWHPKVLAQPTVRCLQVAFPFPLASDCFCSSAVTARRSSSHRHRTMNNLKAGSSSSPKGATSLVSLSCANKRWAACCLVVSLPASSHSKPSSDDLHGFLRRLL